MKNHVHRAAQSIEEKVLLSMGSSSTAKLHVYTNYKCCTTAPLPVCEPQCDERSSAMEEKSTSSENIIERKTL